MHPVLKTHLEKRELRHAYLLTGDLDISREMAMEVARVLLEKENLQSHQDFFHQKFELFGIDESRGLIYKASQKPIMGENKVFIIELFSFSIESANALLKLFEEPYAGTHFFIITSSSETVIPTLRSRLTIINSQEKKEFNEEDKKFYADFLRALPNKRLDLIKGMEKDKQKSAEFINGLEIFVEQSSSENKFQALEEIQRARKFFFDRASSVKMIFEYLALNLPKM